MSVTDDLHIDISGVNLQVADRVCDGERPVSGHVSSHAIVEGPWPATDRQTAAEEGAGHRNGTQHYCQIVRQIYCQIYIIDIILKSSEVTMI